MARQTFEDWIPEEYGGAVVTKVQQMSAIEAHARREPMTSDVKNVPRSGGMSFGGAIGKGLAYTEDGATNDDVTLTALKFGRAMRVADEDLKDTANVVNIIQTKQLDWARAYAVGFDQACLGTSAAANGTTVPFLSLYQALNTTNSAVGYTADDHVVATSAGVAPTYANLSDVFGKVEEKCRTWASRTRPSGRSCATSPAPSPITTVWTRPRLPMAGRCSLRPPPRPWAPRTPFLVFRSPGRWVRRPTPPRVTRRLVLRSCSSVTATS